MLLFLFLQSGKKVQHNTGRYYEDFSKSKRTEIPMSIERNRLFLQEEKDTPQINKTLELFRSVRFATTSLKRSTTFVTY